MGSSLAECSTPSLPSPRYPTVHHEEVLVLRQNSQTIGLRVRLSTFPDIRDGKSVAFQTRDVFFGDSAQDVVCAIGAPARTFYKSEDKMKIHSPNAFRKAASHKSDYFYNYFTLGIDILLDARTNRVKKFVLHTNFPGHYNFNMYHRCQFELPLNFSGLLDHQLSGTMTPVNITSFSRWDQISEKLKPSEKPVVLNRASSTNTTNPFGSTFCYGYQDIIFEVMPNFHIASVTLYSPDSGQSVSNATSSNISPSTISLSTSNSSTMPSNYSTSNPTSGTGYTVQNNKYCGGGSGGGNNASRSGHHNKYQQGLNNRASDLELMSNISDN